MWQIPWLFTLIGAPLTIPLWLRSEYDASWKSIFDAVLNLSIPVFKDG